MNTNGIRSHRRGSSAHCPEPVTSERPRETVTACDIQQTLHCRRER